MYYYNKKIYLRVFINFFIFFLALLASLIVLFYQNQNGYELLFTQPLVFSFFFIILLSKILFKDTTRLFYVVFSSAAALRYLVLPVLIVLSDYYGGRSLVEPAPNSYARSILLMNYELIAICIVIFLIENHNKYTTKAEKNTAFSLEGTNYGYFLFGVITLFGIILFPNSMSTINIIFPNSLEYDLELAFIENIIVYFAIVAKQLTFVIFTKKLYKMFLINKKEIYVFLSFVLALFNVLIYFGTNRTDIIVSTIVSFLLLFKLFGKVVKKYFIITIIILLIVIFIVTVARDHRSISEGGSLLVDITDTIQIYMGGVYNVAIAIETKEVFPQAGNLSVLFFDIFRPMIGVNFLVRTLPFEYSNIFFNQRIWGNIERRSQILPMIGQGYIFFGFLFSPILSFVFVKIQSYLEKLTFKTTSLEIYYFLSLSVVRFGIFMGQNTMNLINDISMNLVLFLMIFYFNKFLNSTIRMYK